MVAPTILFVCPPEPGHILPVVPLAARLRTAGFTCIFLTAGQFASYLRSENFSAVAYKGSERSWPPDAVFSPQSTGAELWRNMLPVGSFDRRHFLERSISEVVATVHPDVIVADRLFHFYGIRLPDLFPATPICYLWTSLPRWGRRNPDCKTENLILCPEELELPQFRLRSANVHYIEPSIGLDRNEAPLPAHLEPSKPVVLCAFGTQHARYQHLSRIIDKIYLAASRLPNVQFIIATGDHDDKTGRIYKKIADNVIMYRAAPQLTILRNCSVLLSHGGLGSLKEAVYMGVPSLVIPLGFDQPYNAIRVERLGIGRRMLPTCLTDTGIKDALIDLMNNRQYHRRVEELMRILRAYEASPKGPSIIAGLTTDSPTPQ